MIQQLSLVMRQSDQSPSVRHPPSSAAACTESFTLQFNPEKSHDANLTIRISEQTLSKPIIQVL